MKKDCDNPSYTKHDACWTIKLLFKEHYLMCLHRWLGPQRSTLHQVQTANYVIPRPVLPTSTHKGPACEPPAGSGVNGLPAVNTTSRGPCTPARPFTPRMWVTSETQQHMCVAERDARPQLPSQWTGWTLTTYTCPWKGEFPTNFIAFDFDALHIWAASIPNFVCYHLSTYRFAKLWLTQTKLLIKRVANARKSCETYENLRKKCRIESGTYCESG